MSQRQVIESDTGDLQFDFCWSDSTAAIAAFGPTHGTLAVSIGDNLIWGCSHDNHSSEGLAGLWIELLEYLSNYWPYLILEQGYPFNAMPIRPSQLDRELESRWEFLDDHRQAEEEEISYAFKVSHNLAESSPGTLRPDLWIVREGGLSFIEAQVATRSIYEQIPSASIKQLLTSVGEAISARLRTATDSRSIAAVTGWVNREFKSEEVLSQIATGLSEVYLGQVCDGDSFSQVLGDPDSSWYDDNVYLDLTYRCKGLLPPKSLRTLLDRIRTSNKGVSQALTDISNLALAELEANEATLAKPYQQGRFLGNWLRAQVADDSGRVEPEAILSDWDVAVDKEDFGTRKLDAVAFWAHSRHPTILWNDSEKHRENKGARRATLAHEICHLLIDRLASLPLTAVAQGAMNRKLEQRANAFAAEFLCPQGEVEAEYIRTASVEQAINRCTSRFGVSKELAAVQLGKSAAVTNLNHQREIVTIGPPGAFYRWDRGN